MTEPSTHSIANFIASEERPDVDEVTSEDQAVAEFMSTRSQLGLLDLPAEVRVMIFRHLLAGPPIQIGFGPWTRGFQLYPDILRTSKLIHRESFRYLVWRKPVLWLQSVVSQLAFISRSVSAGQRRDTKRSS